VFAAVSVTAMVPISALSGLVGSSPLIVLASVAMVVAICCACSGSPVLRVFGGVLGGVLAFALVPFNSTVPMWEGLVILAVMFLGTAVCRAETSQSTWWSTACAAVVVIACAVGECVLARRRVSFHPAWLDRDVLVGRAHFRCRPRVASPVGTALAGWTGHDQLLGLPGASGAAGGERRHDRPGFVGTMWCASWRSTRCCCRCVC
jgi:hypothetical protein